MMERDREQSMAAAQRMTRAGRQGEVTCCTHVQILVERADL